MYDQLGWHAQTYTDSDMEGVLYIAVLKHTL